MSSTVYFAETERASHEIHVRGLLGIYENVMQFTCNPCSFLCGMFMLVFLIKCVF